MGFATATLLASRGAIISLADINEDAMKTATASLPGKDKHMYTVVDVRDSKSVNAWIDSTVQRLGRLDAAVNMAGIITAATPVAEETDDNWDFNFAVNTRGVFFCLRAQINAMKPGGSIVSINTPTTNPIGTGLRITDSQPNRYLRPVYLDRWVLQG